MSVRSAHGRPLTAIALVVIALLVSVPFVQTRHRARVSTDLATAIHNDTQGVPVIVHGDRAKVLRLAERHGVRVKKLLRSGAVFEAARGELESLAQDPEVDHLSGDTPVHSALDITAETIG